MLSIEFELRPVEACRLTRLAGRPALGFNSLSDGALALEQQGIRLLRDYSAGWPSKTLEAPDVHLLTFFDDLTSVLAIQVKRNVLPEALGEGTAVDILDRYEAMLAAEDEEAEGVPEAVLAAGDFLVARSVYLPGDTRLLILDRGDRIELACEGQGGVVERTEFLALLRHAIEHFFLQMRHRAEQVTPLQNQPGYLPPSELLRQGQQWQRRIEALLKRAWGEKFAPLPWPW